MAGPMDPHGPLGHMGRWDDPELADVFRDDPELYELSRTLRASRPEPIVGPHFEPYLRARLMDAAAHELRPRGFWRALRPRPGLFAGGGAALGVAMIAAVVVATVMFHPNDVTTFQVSANVAENHQVSPDDVIRVSFNQAVDHTAIERNLQIRPATSVQTRWDGTTLVITPLHHLSANTPYTVTIPRTAVITHSGATARADVRITFGTKATPSAGPTAVPAQPPVLQAEELGPVNGDSSLLIAPNGSVVATSGLVPSTSSPSPQATSAAGATPSPTSLLKGPPHRILPLASPSVGASPSASPVAASALLQLESTSGPQALGPAATAAVYSASGRSLAYLVAGASQASLVVARADGSHPVTLARSVALASPLAWSGEDALLYVASGQLMSVDLQGRSRPVGGGLRIAPGQDVAVAPGGHVVYVGPAPGAAASPPASADTSALPSDTPTPSPDSVGHLVDLATGSLHPLQGIRQLPAFSGDGATVAWVDESGATPVLEVMSTADSATPTTLSTPAAAGDTVAGVALSGDGTRLAYTLAQGNATPALRVVTVSSGETVAVGDGQPVASPVLSQNGDRIAFLRPSGDGLAAVAALIPGSTPVTPAADAMPADAAALIDRFVTAQLTGDTGTLHALAAATLTLDPSLTPGRVTRYYVIKAALDTSTGTAIAQVRLVRDATAAAPVTSFADETLKLARPADGQPFQVVVAAISDFQGEPGGPQVLHVATERQQAALVVRISFDSDLDPSTVGSSAFSLLGAGGAALPADVRYEVESRTVVVRLLEVPAGALTLTVGDGLRDIAGQALAGGYTTTVQG